MQSCDGKAPTVKISAMPQPASSNAENFAGAAERTRPIRSENRALLVASIARGRRWLEELIADLDARVDSIAP